ncbi:MAG: hypothetical protein ABJG86_09445 [Nitratireductor sp.]
MIRILVLTSLVALAATPAAAIARYQSEALDCGQAQAILEREGAAIFRYRSKRNPSLTLYDRYVLHGGYCGWDEYAANGWIPTRDDPQCFVRVCKPKIFHEDPF